MNWATSGEMKFGYFDSLNQLGILNAVFTRRGGVSPAQWASLNLGGTIGDSRENVIENRRRIFSCVGKLPETIFDVWQVHGSHVICAKEARPLNSEHQKADIILTDCPGITLFMRFADCAPIFLCDPVHKVVGIVHSGWMGTVDKVAAVAVAKMQEKYHSQPKEILAAIGPCIGPDHYEVGQDVIVRARDAFGDEAEQVLLVSGGRTKFDIWRANELVLHSAGVEQIDIAGICTACHTGDWYSHRAENGKTGRFGALISLS